jgi:hypothetical protein
MTRRRFLQTVATIPPAFVLGHTWASTPDPSRVALVIGNSAYQDAPLVNPVNDARAVGSLLDQAGFTVTSQLNSKRVEMLDAIERFTAAAKRPETKLVVFYYAGHGAQLDWRNYLLPVDAVAQTAAELRQSCVDLNQWMAQLGNFKDKTFVIMLDACRNNPFGRSYQPEQKGLSQFDAPVGSLLAYATSPGNVASDGTGQNGLYTENLVRELSIRGTRIEDALKRVRLNVRLSSKGAQIPWETTSLEGDVFIFNDGQKKLTEAEQEKQLEADLGEWARIKTSKNVEDWVGYLRNYPNGRFSEIAQTRLARLLLQVEKPPAPAVSSIAATPMPVAPTAPAIQLGAGLQVPQLIQVSVNPFSAGSFPLGRNYSLGDAATVRVTDLLTGVEGEPLSYTVTKIDLDNDRIEYNNGTTIVDSMGNYVRTVGGGPSDVPQQMNPAELQVGKTWEAGWKQTNLKYGEEFISMSLRIAAFETVRVPAGEFQAFRVEMSGWQKAMYGIVRREGRFWLVPGLNFGVKAEVWGRFKNRIVRSDRLELATLRQQSIDTRCAVLSGDLKRNLVVKNSCR